jgi:hypothetical protein
MENWRRPYICVEQAQFYMASSDRFLRRFGGAAFYIKYHAQLRLSWRAPQMEAFMMRLPDAKQASLPFPGTGWCEVAAADRRCADSGEPALMLPINRSLKTIR